MITQDQYAPFAHRPQGVDAIIDEMLALWGIDEFAKRDAWTDEDHALHVKEQLARIWRQNSCK